MNVSRGKELLNVDVKFVEFGGIITVCILSLAGCKIHPIQCEYIS